MPSALHSTSSKNQADLICNFRNEYVAKTDVEAVARAIADVVVRNTPGPGERTLLEMWRFPPDVRPPKVSEIDISHWKEPADSIWSISLGGAVPRLAPKKVQEVIDAKEDRLPAYRSRCSTVWLLIAIDGFSPSGWWDIQQNVVNTRYHTNFDRVILYEHFGRRSFTIVDGDAGDAHNKSL